MRILYSHRIGCADGRATARACISTNSSPRCCEAGHEVLVVGPSLYDNMEFGSDQRLRRADPQVPAQGDQRACRACLQHRRLSPAQPRLPAFQSGPDLRALQSVLSRRHAAGAPAQGSAVSGGQRPDRGRARPLQRACSCAGSRTRSKTTFGDFRSSPRVLAVTNVLKGIVARTGVSPERIYVTHNGIHLDQFPVQAGHAPETDPVVLGVHRLRCAIGLDGLDPRDRRGAPIRAGRLSIWSSPARGRPSPALRASVADLASAIAFVSPDWPIARRCRRVLASFDIGVAAGGVGEEAAHVLGQARSAEGEAGRR